MGFLDPPYNLTLTDDSGAALDLTGCTSNSFTLTMLNQNTGLAQQGAGVWTVANQSTFKGQVSYQWTNNDMATAGPWMVYTTAKLPGEPNPREFDPEFILILPGTVGAGAAPAGVLPAPIAKALYFNVMDYGARGDGTTDDTSAIQTTITAASATKGTVYFPQGTYKITSGLTITTSGVSLLGTGAGASIIQTPSGSESIAMLIIGDGANTCADVRIADLQFLGVTQKTANAAIKLQKCFRTHLERLRTQNQYRAIYVYNSTQTWVNDTDLRDTKENGIVYEATFGNGFDLYLNNVVADNPVVSNTGIGKISSANGDIVGLTFTNGWSGTSTNYGVLIDGGSGGLTQGIRFIGHKSLHNGLAGFRLAGGLDVELNGCDAVGNSQTSANSRSGIEIASTSMTFSIVGCRSTNGWQQGNTQSNGINFDSGTYTSGLIANNDLRGNTNNALALNGAVGTLSIKNNQGYNPVGQVTAPSFPATTVAATNNTGSDVTAYIANGTAAITVIQIAGASGSYVTTGYQIAASGWGSVRIPAGGSVKFTFASGAPTWTWFAD